MSDITDLRFFRFGVRARIYEADRYIETIFPDGSAVPACPQPTSEYRATAGRLGYGDDVWRMCLEHELAHTELMQALGLHYSPTLWAVAHGHSQSIYGSPGEMGAEEDFILAYQRWRMIRKQAAEREGAQNGDGQ